MSDLPVVDNLRPRRNDVILVHVPREESKIIHVEENPEQNDLQQFIVARLGNDVKSVEVGELALISWTRVTDPMDGMYKGEKVKFGVTEETEILAIVDED
jgi:hypothetical protein